MTKPAKPARKPRTTRTPAERAQERVDVLERRQTRQLDALSEAETLVDQLTQEVAATEARLEHARKDPDITGDTGMVALDLKLSEENN